MTYHPKNQEEEVLLKPETPEDFKTFYVAYLETYRLLRGTPGGGFEGALTAMAVCLSTLDNQPATIQSISDIVGVSRRTVGRIVRGLVDEGLLTIDRVAEGRQQTEIRHTPEGARIAKGMVTVAFHNLLPLGVLLTAKNTAPDK